MSPRPDVSEERKRQIIEAATRVFTRLGIKDARMDDIVEESGLSKGALYWYFDSKDDIIVAIVKRLLDRELGMLEDMRAAGRPAKERLLAFVDLVVDDFRDLMHFMPILYEFYGMAMRSKTIRRMFTAFFRKYMQVITPIIEQGVADGEFRPVDPQDAAIAVGAVIEGTILLLVYDPETVDFEKHIRSGIDIALVGLLEQP